MRLTSLTLWAVALIASGTSAVAVGNDHLKPILSPITHGSHAVVGGRNFRYRQVARGMFQGVDADEWDDKIHVNDRDLAVPFEDLETRDLEVLDDRDLRDTCKAAANCFLALAHGAHWGVSRSIDAFIAAAQAANNNRNNIIDFLSNPFVTTVTVGNPAIGGVVSAYVSHKLSSGQSQEASNCSSSSSQADLVASAVKGVLQGKGEALAVEMNITLPDGSTVSISIQATEKDYETIGMCNAPSTKED